MLGAGSIFQIYSEMIARSERFKIARQGWRWIRTSPTLHVWGTGLIRADSPTLWPQKMIICATRGALSAKALNVDVPHGDPGILANLLLDHQPAKRAAVGFVPHHADADDFQHLRLPKGWALIDPRQPVLDVVEAIAATELVVSSSLHGLIVADSFGIPCVRAWTTRPPSGSRDFKFDDHASARGQPFGAPLDYESALNSSPDSLAEIATIPARSMPEWQAKLIATFPFQ